MKPHGHLAIVAYRCRVGGIAHPSLDIQAVWFEESDPDEVRRLINANLRQGYENPDGNTVTWELAEVFAIEPFETESSGEEVAGFIAEIDELNDLTQCES